MSIRRYKRFLILVTIVLVCLIAGDLFKNSGHVVNIVGLRADQGNIHKNKEDPVIEALLKKKTLTDDEEVEVIHHFGFNPYEIKSISAETLFQLHRTKEIDIGEDYLDWGKVAYVQYATDLDHVCPAVINFNRLRQLGAKADFLFLYAGNQSEVNNESEKEMLKKIESTGATIKYVKPIELPSESSYWEKSFTKLYSFSLTEYDRVVFFDSDSLVLKSMDELFTLPDSVLAMPVNYINFRDFDKLKLKLEGAIETPYDRANELSDYYAEIIEPETGYDDIEWLMKIVYASLPSLNLSIKLLKSYGLQYQLASYIMVIHPNKDVFNSLMEALNHRKKNEYDMDVLNNVFNLEKIARTHKNYYSLGDQSYIPLIQVIPHNPYALLSGELRKFHRSHDCYLADPINLPEIGYDYPELKNPGVKTSPIGYLQDEESESTTHLEIPYWSWYWDKQVTTYGWSSNVVLGDAKLVHFSDAPLPKPWTPIPDIRNKLALDAQIQCEKVTGGNKLGCEKEVNQWVALYDKYSQLAQQYC
ncbi:hypothetical protein FOA43_003342 [Brettanomyces nanus]|uniref:Uncharacterized protein n=1 Tax=Eeniella nana TaxID=13502 RepID=A0A875S3Q9_EENNA|nr:uncharacterized protein FOA43_003342 [Brettanomyces nanus]QPG75956.1 hypothetical protein FOA43_003342 [Brettanomyces nanus]